MMTSNLKKKSRSRLLMKWLHLWPGIISALILIFVCITGTIFVYSDEIIDHCAGDARYVKEVLPNRMPVEKLMDILSAHAILGRDLGIGPARFPQLNHVLIHLLERAGWTPTSLPPDAKASLP